MASITLRRLDEGLKARLRLRAARHARSMEQEAREILKAVLQSEPAVRPNLADSIRRHIRPLGGVEVPDRRREVVRRLPNLLK